MTTSVHELDLPEVDISVLGRSEALAAYEDAGRRHWLAKIPMGYCVTRYEDVSAVLRERRFHSALATLGDGAGGGGPMEARQKRSILATEGTDHTRLRRLASPAFTPRATDRLRPFMREVMNDLVDRVSATGRCDLVHDICEPYPIPIICELLGAPKDDWKLFSDWATDIFRMFNGDIANDRPLIEAAMRGIEAYVRAMVEDRRQRPADDLLSRLIAVEEAGDRLSTDELAMMAEAVLMAGTDTTRNQLACSVAILAEHPDQWAKLVADPSLAGQAVEETMRHLGAVRGTARIASEDIELNGVIFPKGTFVAASILAANHDESIWDEPHRFDITREVTSAAHLTFGSGVHFCLGASLARAELQEGLVVLAERLPDLAIDGPIQWKPASAGIWGPSHLPLRFTPRP